MNLRVDFLASRPHFLDHLLPVWQKVDAAHRGFFYVPESLAQYAESQSLEATPLKPKIPSKPLHVLPPGDGPIVTCAYADLQRAVLANPRRVQIFMEHGVGITFRHPAYAGGLGMRRKVDLFLAPNDYIRAKTAQVLPAARQVVIGTPKLDCIPRHIASERPVVCISFHWDGSRVAPEAGNAFRHYEKLLPALKERYALVGHAHPKAPEIRAAFLQLGIEFVETFAEVLARADLYVNDCSSTLYEFCVTGRPVVILNAPWFRRKVQWGLRFWDYTDIGPLVEQPGELIPAIDALLAEPACYAEARSRMVADLYPCRGVSAETAARAIEAFA